MYQRAFTAGGKKFGVIPGRRKGEITRRPPARSSRPTARSSPRGLLRLFFGASCSIIRPPPLLLRLRPRLFLFFPPPLPSYTFFSYFRGAEKRKDLNRRGSRSRRTFFLSLFARLDFTNDRSSNSSRNFRPKSFKSLCFNLG